ncbi:MAG TPA: molecular chaperone [Hyphomonadaceae bacterium]|nr:molecular chaperone [Hyphomonadaceae bacterium]
MWSPRKLWLAGFLATGLATAGVATAASIQIGPTSILLVGPERTAIVTVRNSDSSPVTVQVRGMDWSQNNGEDVQTPSATLVVSPPFATLQPGESQTVRLLIENVEDAKTERAFRLVIDEVPNPVTRASTGLQTTLRLVSPVFLSPSIESRPLLTWTTARSANGVVLSVRNDGKAHERISDMQVSVDGKVVAEGAAFGGYVLANGSRSWVLPAAGAGDAVITGAGNYGPVNARVAIAR